VRWSDEWGNPFTVLTGVIGRGERDELPHLQAKELAALLTARGADPFDTQALYNTAVQDDDASWLEFLWSESERVGVLERWREVPTGRRIGGKIPMNALDFLLGVAVRYRHVKRVQWLLDHGAQASGVHAYSARPLHEEALVYGSPEIAERLVRFGAEPRPLHGHAAFYAAVACLDRETASAMATRNPQALKHAHLMLEAAGAGRAEVVAFLLDLGMDVDVADHTGRRGLHHAVMAGSLETVKLLVARGAAIDRPTAQYDGALGWAAFFKRSEIADFLAPLSRDVWNLTYLDKRDRLLVVLAENPALVNARHPHFGGTPLFHLPEDEDAAVDLATLLIAHGADTQATNKKGLTAEQNARELGLIEAADVIHGEDE
jgi:ankyrin repeat protein